MISLSPKAYRLVAEAVSLLPVERRMAWHELTSRHGAALSPDATLIAQEALRIIDQRLRQALAADKLDEDTEAELANDLGFICAIESDLSKSLQDRHA